MEWLKAILDGATVTDGKIDVDAVMKQVNAEFPKHAVPKKDYNDKVAELKTANDTITDLKKDNGDNAALQQKVSDYEAEINDLKKKADSDRKTYALKNKLTAAGVLDADYMIYKQGGVDKFTFDKEGVPVGLDDILKPMRETSPHLFKAANAGANYNPAGGNNPPAVNPWKKDTFNLTEQGKILRSDPEKAKQLAAAAGATI